jgi:hypothetical protein
VPNPIDSAFQGRLAQRVFEVAELARGAANLEHAFGIHHRNASGIVTPVFEVL